MHDIGRGDLRAPARVIDLDVADRDSSESVDVSSFSTAWCLVRRRGIPVATGFLDVADDTWLPLGRLRDHFADHGLDNPDSYWPGVDDPLTVVVCTRDRPDSLRLTLASLACQTDDRFDVLVVDNSATGEVAGALAEFAGLRLRCCHEPTPGKSHALNRALAEVRTPYVGFLDDDLEAAPDWLHWVRIGLAHPDRPAAVMGVMAPAQLETTAQVDFERFGGFHKGRGMSPVSLRARTPTAPEPFLPLPNYGAGGNMTCRTESLRAVGGFDTRLGPGTAIHGGEETRSLALILDQGQTVLHWPPAITWHYHRRSDDDLEKQFFGYTAGLTGFFMSLMFRSPKNIWRILRFIPRGVKAIAVQSDSDEPTGAALPRNLVRARRRGLWSGGWLYLGEVLRQHRHTARTP